MRQHKPDINDSVPLAAILDPTLGYKLGPTQTHALVFGSPAVDVVFGAPCATTTDQRGAPRAQDGDGDSFNDCDAGAVERGLVQAQATLNNTRVECRAAACQAPVTCNLTETGCTNEVELAWFRKISRTQAASFPMLRQTFGSADYVDGFTIFDVGGNRYRICTVIHYDKQRLYVRDVMTHAEYDRNAWRKR